VTRKLPITPLILLQIKSLLVLSNPRGAVFWAACLVAFFGFFRKSNLFGPSGSGFDPSKHLCRSDFLLYPWGLAVQIRWSKTIQFGERVLVTPLPRLPGHPLCPVEAVVQAFALTKSAKPQGPAFMVPKGFSYTPFSPHAFVVKLRAHLDSLGLHPSHYSGHSFRRGSASWAIQNGLPGEIIKILGDWKSDAYLAYLTLNHVTKLNSMVQFSESLPAHL
jgi:hypothetical protein